MQESWLNENDGAKLVEIKELGYEVLSNPRKRRGGGVAIFYKKLLKLSLCSRTCKYKSLENIEATLKTDDELVRFVSIYRPPYSRKHRYTETDFLIDFEDYLSVLNSKSGLTVIMGDLNMHVQKDQDSHVVMLNTLLREYSLKQIAPLNPTNISGNTLDLIIVPEDAISKFTDVYIDSLICHSDHYLVSCDLHININVQENPHKFLEYRNFSSMSIDLFKIDIKNSCLHNPEMHFSSSDEACSNYSKILKCILDKHCPMIKRKIFNKHEIWFDEELRDFRRRRRKAERKFRKTPTVANKQMYMTLCKDMTKLVKSKRKGHCTSSIKNAKGDSKALYSKIGSLLGKQSKILPQSVDDETLAEEFKQHFTTKIGKIRKDIEEEQLILGENNYNKSVYPETSSELNSFTELSSAELKKIVQNLPNKNSPLDIIPNWLLKDCFDELEPVLLYIVNHSIKEGEFPQSLKHACVIPTVKDFSGNHDDLKNYRPISNLSTISKILEKCVSNQLNEYLNVNDLHCSIQSGYRQGHSCETLLIKMNDDLIKEADKNNLIAVVLLDLSAAFDAIDHEILLKKLKVMYGIKSFSLKWFQSYLKDRSFSVIIKSAKSGIEIILYGVPQGSILGPILFILFTKDLSDIVKKYGINLHLYADDSTLYLALNPLDSVNIESVKGKLQQCLEEIKTWMTYNFMKLNEDKTKIIVFGKRSILKKNSSMDFSLNFNGNNIESLDLSLPGMHKEGKSLGIFLNNDLSMQRHISAVRKVCFGVMHNLRNIKEFLDIDTKLTLIKCLIISKIDFCNSLYMNIPQYLINKLNSLLNYCIRFVFHISKRTSTSQYYLKAHILPINFRIQFKCLLLIHKCIHGSAPDYLKGMLKCCNMDERYNLRTAGDIFSLDTVHTARTTVFAHRRFSVYAPIIWNDLPGTLRFSEDTEQFKKLLKTFLFKQFEELSTD